MLLMIVLSRFDSLIVIMIMEIIGLLMSGFRINCLMSRLSLVLSISVSVMLRD